MLLPNRIKVFAILTLTLLLAACGGGGGDSSPAPGPTPVPTVTVTCPSGMTQTAQTQASAEALCPAPKLVSVTPADKSLDVSPDTFAGTTVITDSVLDASSVTAANIKLMMGLTSVPGSITMSGDRKGFTFISATKLGYGQNHNLTAEVRDALGKTLSVATTFTTASITCTAPKVPDVSGNNCVDPVVTFTWPTDVKTLMEPGVVNGVVNPANAVRTWLPLNPVTNIVGDANWNANLTNGNVQIVKSGEMAPDINGVQRNIWRAVYSMVEAGRVINCISPIYADSGLSYVNDNAVGTTCALNAAPAYVVGVSDPLAEKNGVIFRVASGPAANSCFLLTVKSTPDVNCPF